LFEVVEWPWLKEKNEKHPTYICVPVNKRQVLSEFIKRWDDFLETQYDPLHWEEYGSNLRQLDGSKLMKSLKNFV
jgi:hypothetical protein